MLLHLGFVPTEHGYNINNDARIWHPNNTRERMKNSLAMVADTKKPALVGLARILCLWFSHKYPQMWRAQECRKYEQKRS
jgi:hypothetical protein